MDFPRRYFDTEGPLGLPMRDSQAQLLDGLLKTLPAEDRALCRLVTAKAPTELLDGERCDVSWITTEAIDRDGEIVLARGVNDSHFKLNPIVTLQHAYHLAPVGRSLWRKRARDGALVGIKAKTQYPPRPDGWGETLWPPDQVFALIQAGLLQGKSIGFLRLKAHAPTEAEIVARPELAPVRRIVDEWLLLEYACTFLPCNQEALVEAVSKGRLELTGAWREELSKLCGKDLLSPLSPAAGERKAALPIVFTAEAEIRRAIERRIAAIDFAGLAQRAVRDGIERARGRV
jgi:hypothetical protein